MTDDLIGRAEAQTAIQFAARRYTVAHEAHGEGQVVWSDNLINVTDAMNALRDLPSAQPDLDEWCTDCKEYDSDKHCCPRFSRVIREALKEAQQERKTGRWIPDGSELGKKCNKCGKSFSDYVNAGTGYMFLEEIPNFCPNCGADMRGEQE